MVLDESHEVLQTALVRREATCSEPVPLASQVKLAVHWVLPFFRSSQLLVCLGFPFGLYLTSPLTSDLDYWVLQLHLGI